MTSFGSSNLGGVGVGDGLVDREGGDAVLGEGEGVADAVVRERPEVDVWAPANIADRSANDNKHPSTRTHRIEKYRLMFYIGRLTGN